MAESKPVKCSYCGWSGLAKPDTKACPDCGMEPFHLFQIPGWLEKPIKESR